MVDQNLLDILVCPETKQPLSLAEPSVLDGVNASIASGSAVNRGGNAVEEALEEGLIREDGAVLYPVRDGIPILLIDESIPLSS